MALSDPDREYIREVAANIAGKVSKQVIEDVLKWHIDACPHGKSILASKWDLLGNGEPDGICGSTGLVARPGRSIERNARSVVRGRTCG